MDTENITLEQAEVRLRYRRWTREQAIEFVRLWNTGGHFTQAVVTKDDRIVNFDPELPNFFRSYYEESGVVI
jgi:hypothetical protein